MRFPITTIAGITIFLVSCVSVSNITGQGLTSLPSMNVQQTQPAGRLLQGKNVQVYLEGKGQSYPIRSLLYDPGTREFVKTEDPPITASSGSFRGQTPLAAPTPISGAYAAEYRSTPIPPPPPPPSLSPLTVRANASDADIASNNYVSRAEFEEALSKQKPSGALIPWKKGSFTITPYGYVNVSAIWESARTTTGDFALFANRPNGNDVDEAFFIDVKSSRLGVKVDGPGISDWWCGSKSRGVFECDFQGEYQMRNRPGFQMRKAYIELYDGNKRILLGQDWEVVSPLNPGMLNYVPACVAGNLGYRRAQIRFDHTHVMNPNAKFIGQFALCDGTPRFFYDTDGGVNGAASGWPLLEARLALAIGEKSFSHGKPITLGVSGHYGVERFDFAARSANRNVPTWSMNFDLDLPITNKVKIQMEFFEGENLSSVEGGILQGADYFTMEGIRSRGGWIAVNYQYSQKLQSNIGFAVDDPLDGDVICGSIPGTRFYSRTYNQVIFANVMYNWTPQFMTGVEASHWKTRWQEYTGTVNAPFNAGDLHDLGNGNSFRIECVARYAF